MKTKIVFSILVSTFVFFSCTGPEYLPVTKEEAPALKLETYTPLPTLSDANSGLSFTTPATTTSAPRTNTPTKIPTNTPLPPLPDFDHVLTYGGGAGGSTAYDYCLSNFPGQIPATTGKKTIRQTAYLCLWGMPYDIPFEVNLISPNNEITLTGIFKATSNNSLVWSGHNPEEHASRAYSATANQTAVFINQTIVLKPLIANMIVISPWWPDDFPSGMWQIHVIWTGGETHGILDANTRDNPEGRPSIRVIDHRLKTEILPSGVIEQRTVHSGDPGTVSGTGFMSNSIVYLLVYTAENTGIYNPTFERFVFVTGKSVLTDDNGKFMVNLSDNFETGRLYMVLGVVDPQAKLTIGSASEINTDAIEAEEIFYIQPPGPVFDTSSTGSVSHGFFIINQLSEKCIDVRGLPGTENEAPLQLWDCEFGDSYTDQRWEFVNDGFLRNVLSGKCMDVKGLPGINNEDQLQLWDCEFSDPNNTDQRWKITSDGFLENLRSGKCIDVRGLPGVSNEDSLQLWDCEYGNSNTDQKWYLK